jgi:hypothetical protein
MNMLYLWFSFSLPALYNVGLLLVLVFFIYAIAGMRFLSQVRSHSSICFLVQKRILKLYLNANCYSTPFNVDSVHEPLCFAHLSALKWY